MSLPDFNLNGRVALVTGAARGIGLSIAKTLAAAGAAVVIQDIDEPHAQQEAAAIAAGGARAIGIGGDATDLSQAALWIEKTVAAFGGLHILVNNASIQSSDDFFGQSDELMRQQFDANVHLVLRLCQYAVPHMQSAGWGRILNLGSIQGRRGSGKMTPYSMTKAAIENMTTALARRFAASAITVNCLAPGWMNTHRNRKDFQTPEQIKENGRYIPMRRTGEPDDCAGAALLLCTNASSYITGQVIGVDGGMSI